LLTSVKVNSAFVPRESQVSAFSLAGEWFVEELDELGIFGATLLEIVAVRYEKNVLARAVPLSHFVMSGGDLP
jgi:hypothetical protein